MSSTAHFFLIVSDTASGESSVEDLGSDLSAAMDAYRAREHQIEDGAEVVLLGSSSLETLRGTHSSYFGASTTLSAQLGLLDHA